MEVSGTVTSVNENGIKVDNGEWLNFSKYTPVDPPSKGDTVQVAVDNKGFIKSIAGGSAPRTNGAPMNDSRNEIIARESAAKSAIAMLAHHQPWVAATAEDKFKGALSFAKKWEGYFMGDGNAKPE